MAGTPPSPSEDASPLGHTRKMLDELDVLMERMLALPVNDPERTAGIEPGFHIPTVSATVTILNAPDEAERQVDVDTEERFEPRTPLPRSARSAPVQTPGYLTESQDVGTTTEEPTDPALGLLPDELLPPSILAMATPPVEARPMPYGNLVNLLQRPLYWTNRGFDRCAVLLGPGGRWLRSPAGRTTLGVIGLFCLGMALAWIIKDWLGWAW